MAAVVELDVSGGISNAKDIFSSAVCAIGVFDGVHLGHRFLIEKAVAKAAEQKGRTSIITFDVDPDELLGSGSAKKLMSNESRIAALADLDVDAVVVLRFDRELASMLPGDFLDALFSDGVPDAIYVGEDFGFGKGGAGSFSTMRDWALKHDGGKPDVFAVELKMQDGEPITSTRIRKLLGQARLQEALDLLGHPYVISGKIVHGRGQGSEFGVCTADLRIPESCMVAADGVYAAYATLGGAAGEQKRYLAAVSVGIPPTFEDSAKANVEAHLLDFEGDIYGEGLTLDFRSYLRPMRKFESIDELVSAIRSDIDTARSVLE